MDITNTTNTCVSVLCTHSYAGFVCPIDATKGGEVAVAVVMLPFDLVICVYAHVQHGCEGSIKPTLILVLSLALVLVVNLDPFFICCPP